MARQTGPVLFEGSISNLTGYQLNGRHFVRVKSGFSKRRIQRDPHFANTRRNAAWFALAVRYAKLVYYELPRNQRDQRRVWYPLRNRAQNLVRKQLRVDEIIRLLREEFVLPIKNANKLKAAPITKVPVMQTLTDEIRLGRSINPQVELLLVDQLAAAVAFTRTVLAQKTGSMIMNRENLHCRRQIP